MLKNGKICPACQKGKLEAQIGNVSFDYQGKEIPFPEEKSFKCDLCDFEGLSKASSKRIEAKLTDFRRSSNGLLTGSQLRKIRTKLGLNIKGMARLLSVNSKTVGRYENSRITQSQQIDKLYRIYKMCPSVVRMFPGGTETFTLLKNPIVEVDNNQAPEEVEIGSKLKTPTASDAFFYREKSDQSTRCSWGN